MNFSIQTYKTIPLQLIDRKYTNYKAMRFTINGTNQNVWVPLKHLAPDGTILAGENIDYVFRRAQNKLEYAGITRAIPGIKERAGNGQDGKA